MDRHLFVLRGVLKFYATDIDDAFRQLGEYFLNLAEDGNAEPIAEEESSMTLDLDTGINFLSKEEK